MTGLCLQREVQEGLSQETSQGGSRDSVRGVCGFCPLRDAGVQSLADSSHLQHSPSISVMFFFLSFTILMAWPFHSPRVTI